MVRRSMTLSLRTLPLRVVVGCALLAASQTGRAGVIALTSANAGSETTTLVPNGGFEDVPGSATLEQPNGWSAFGEGYASTAIINGFAADQTRVAAGYVTSNASVAMYYRQVSGLTPGATYVLSAYVWNFGDATHHVTAVIDLDDLPSGDAQSTVSYSDPGATTGLFVFNSFVAPVGGTVNVRAFYDGRVGGTTGWPMQPVAAQWDNVAITLESNFVPVQDVPVPEIDPAGLGSVLALVTGAVGLLERRRIKSA